MSVRIRQNFDNLVVRVAEFFFLRVYDLLTYRKYVPKVFFSYSHYFGNGRGPKVRPGPPKIEKYPCDKVFEGFLWANYLSIPLGNIIYCKCGPNIAHFDKTGNWKKIGGSPAPLEKRKICIKNGFSKGIFWWISILKTVFM